MRIARVLTRLNLGGPARQALAGDRELRARGHEVRLFCGTPQAGEGDLHDAFVAAGHDVVRVPGLGRGPSLVGDARALLRLRRELRAYAPDVLHTHASKAGLLGRLALPAAAPAARVHTFHGHVLEGYFGPRASAGLARLERALARRTELVLAVSHATGEDLVRLGVVEEDRLVVVPPGVDLAPLLALEGRHGALRRFLGVPDDGVLVGVLGRLAEVKCPARAVDVFRMLADRHPGLHLCFVGDGGERRDLERRLEALPPGQRERAHLIGTRDDVVEVLADLDVVLCTSRSEGLPVALIEAAAAAKAVVSTPVGGVPELVAHERTGMLGEGVDELAYGLDQLLAHPLGRLEMGRRARLRVEQRHSAAALAERLEAVYVAARDLRGRRGA
ncbi:MAG: glycosyltransferase family 4 protein [Planctomycetes bacterium]|nr:glycosyltransferase family 4 protein [Planctomycetota bacterium]